MQILSLSFTLVMLLVSVLLIFPLFALSIAVSLTVKPGVRYRELGNIIQKHAQANGFSVVKSYCGHGIHRLFHTAPNVPHYASEWRRAGHHLQSPALLLKTRVCVLIHFPENKAVGVMKAGHVFTIEPMICEGERQ